ncbi:50S ribosomal protein L13 [Sandaracinus amylolyticus]|uniref:Large ribosomal subunit protein uL13 n=1 Tax=Sandaracinus amylolyticus TaxID=927083 RepID=A0A0F6SEX6_9BACT|nr:50S ribosomal protein L13 [Sandaracinus amylolyticus]AKF05959.1 LSU ribosomal protein L13p (L13Ae) [Sandaracinus amylolyticus]UJR81350.1 LSU ribosomal protein L13P [Sandaracinus amylolyticus]
MRLLRAQQTHSANPAEVNRRWFVVDAEGQPLGRVASRIAAVLRGKHTPLYTPHVDTGDFVVVINAEKVKLTGAKLDDKFYYKHSGIPGGFRAEPYRKLLDRKPEFALEKAVKGMLPKTPLGRKMHTKLKVYAGPTHPHAAQKPEVLKF